VVGEEAAGAFKKTEEGKMEALSVRFGPKPEGDQPAKKEKRENSENTE
jgi:hypothetical protein